MNVKFKACPELEPQNLRSSGLEGPKRPAEMEQVIAEMVAYLRNYAFIRGV